MSTGFYIFFIIFITFLLVAIASFILEDKTKDKNLNWHVIAEKLIGFNLSGLGISFAILFIGLFVSTDTYIYYETDYNLSELSKYVGAIIVKDRNITEEYIQKEEFLFREPYYVYYIKDITDPVKDIEFEQFRK